MRTIELQARLEALEREVALDNELLASQKRLVSMFDCPLHGECIPFAIEEVNRLRAAATERDNLKVELHGLAEAEAQRKLREGMEEDYREERQRSADAAAREDSEP